MFFGSWLGVAEAGWKGVHLLPFPSPSSFYHQPIGPPWQVRSELTLSESSGD